MQDEVETQEDKLNALQELLSGHFTARIKSG